jgi:polyhydroxyalkanoate synthesis regulator phasin
MQFLKLYERSRKMTKVKNRILFISLAMMLALTMGLTGCALSQGEAQILSEGLTGGVVAAVSTSSNNTEDQSQVTDRYQALLDRACAIYEESTGVAIDSEQLKDAMDQAQSELQKEALETRLQNLVDNGKITQEEADQYLEWWQSRPDIEAALPGLGGHGPGGHIAAGPIAAGNDTASGTEDQTAPSDRYQALLDRACAIYEENTGVAIDSGQLKAALEQAQSEMQNEALKSRLQDLVDNGKITQEEADQYLEWWQSRPDIEVPLPGLGGPGPGGGMMQARGFGLRGGPCPGPDASAEAGD